MHVCIINIKLKQKKLKEIKIITILNKINYKKINNN